MTGAAIKNLISKHGATAGAAAMFNAGDLTTPGNQLKGILGTLKDMALMRVALATGFAGLFIMLASGIKDLIKVTGSLEAALKKLSQIQQLTKAFEQFAGSAKKARAEVQLFVNFARDKSLKFENVAEAAKTLSIFGRGILGGVQNLNMLNDAAAGTGNTLNATANAAAQFAAALNSRSGIPEAIDNLEEMGLIADKTADKLKEMNMRGGTRATMLGVFKQDIVRHAGAADEQRNTIEGAKARQAAAITAIKEGFGQGAAGDEAEAANTKATILEMLAPAAAKTGAVLWGVTKALNPLIPLGQAAAGWAAKLGPAPKVGPDSEEKMAALKAQKDRIKEARFGFEAVENIGIPLQARRRAIDLQMAQAGATRGGDADAVSRIENARMAEEFFNQNVAAGYSREWSAQRGIDYAQDMIKIRGNQAGVNLNAAAAVSDLARIGGGGGVEQVSGGMDIQREMLKVDQDMKQILQDIKTLIADPEGSGLL